MNRERAKELLPIIQAFAEGKAIQFRLEGLNGDHSWNDLLEDERMTVTFPAEDYEYRIKPEPMEIWVNVYPDKSHSTHFNRDDAISEASECYCKPDIKHFREVTE